MNPPIPHNPTAPLDVVHHIAIPCSDVHAARQWFRERFQCSVLYEDKTWVLLEFGNIKLALTRPDEHGTHIGFSLPLDRIFGAMKQSGHDHIRFDSHRDGSMSCCTEAPLDAYVEFILNTTDPYAPNNQTPA